MGFQNIRFYHVEKCFQKKNVSRNCFPFFFNMKIKENFSKKKVIINSLYHVRIPSKKRFFFFSSKLLYKNFSKKNVLFHNNKKLTW